MVLQVPVVCALRDDLRAQQTHTQLNSAQRHVFRLSPETQHATLLTCTHAMISMQVACPAKELPKQKPWLTHNRPLASEKTLTFI
jgi:hypothetical protein